MQVLAGPCSRDSNALFELHRLRGLLLGVVVCGIKDVSRAIITLKEDGEKTAAERASGRKTHKILVEGTGLQVRARARAASRRHPRPHGSGCAFHASGLLAAFG